METEEGFTLAVRRMLRSSNTYHVIHVAYSLFGFIRNNRELLLLLRNSTADLVQPAGGTVYHMRKGDQFIVFPEAAASKISTLADTITAAAFPDRALDAAEDQPLTRVFHIPQDYMELRQAATAYTEAAAGAAPPPTDPAAAPDLKTLKAELDGPLTAWSLSRIENALPEIDIKSYIRSQGVYETDHNGAWTPLFEEHFTSVVDLQRDGFPKLVFKGDERLFVELCAALDRRSVPEILRRHRAKPGRRISFNVTLGTFASGGFQTFVKESGDAERQSIILEINRSDLLHQPRETVKALARMREAGFGVALDGVTFDLLAITNLHRIDVDYVKISLRPSQMWMLKDGDCVAALKKLPRDKIILCRCEKETAIPVGRAFGLTKFQGWVIDRLSAGKPATGDEP